MEADLAALRSAAPAADGPVAVALRVEPAAYQDLFEPERESAREPRPRRAPRPHRELDLGKLLGARALAATGGIVSLLGIVFFFALAVERGWIGPGARVTLGAIASALALGAGWWLRRRFGETHSSLAAAAAGIAGFYATLAAASVRYDLVPSPVALVLAAAIAAAATGMALRWHDELLASIGLVGAVLAPVAVAAHEHEQSIVGVAFAALMLAAAAVVGLRRTWHWLVGVASVCAGLQIIGLCLDASGRTADVLLLAIVFWALFLGIGCAEALTRGELTRFAATYVIGGSAFSGYAAAALFGGDELGWALLASATVDVVVAAVVFRRNRNLASLSWAAALALGGIGTAQLISGATLTMAWSAEAALLAWLAVRLREPRFRLAALAWLGLALVHVLTFDSPLSRLFERNEHPAAGVPSLIAVVAASAAVGWFAERWEIRLVVPGLGALLALDAASLCVLALPRSWDWGHVGVITLWGVVAIALTLTRLRLAGAAWAAATAALALCYDLFALGGSPRWTALAVAGAAVVVVGLLFERELGHVSAAAAGAGAAFLTAAALGIADGDLAWLLVLVAAGIYCALGAALLRRRDQSTLLWAIGLVLAGAASAALLQGTWLVLAWAGTAVAVTLLARFEPRLDFAALAALALVALETLAREAPLTDLFEAQRHPASGVPALLLVAAAAALYAWQREPLRVPVGCGAAVLAVFAASLGILELSESLGSSVETTFQRGHTAVSALWGVVGLALLYAGLVRNERGLQLGGFALFGLSLAKLFVYDLAFLSSVTRALSFLAVGAVLIAGGFFYQRLTAEPG